MQRSLLAGVITGVCGFTHEWMSAGLHWTQSERNIYFWPVAVFGFLLPMIFLVAGIDYFIEQTRKWEDLLRLGGRVVLWFAGAAGTTFVLDLVLRLLS
jgi:hypothetical protein